MPITPAPTEGPSIKPSLSPSPPPSVVGSYCAFHTLCGLLIYNSSIYPALRKLRLLQRNLQIVQSHHGLLINQVHCQARIPLTLQVLHQ